MTATWSVCYHPMGHPRSEDDIVLINVKEGDPPERIVDNFADAGVLIKWLLPMPHVHMKQ